MSQPFPASKRTRAPASDDAEKSDARYIMIEGRRWRRSDPAIPEPLRVELVRALMNARRAVRQAKRAEDARAERDARASVQEAKLALGERGTAWWERQDEEALRTRAVATARALLRQRGADKTICPSDVARVVGGGGWRQCMQLVRDALIARVEAGELELRQRGKAVNPKQARGPLRLALR